MLLARLVFFAFSCQCKSVPFVVVLNLTHWGNEKKSVIMKSVFRINDAPYNGSILFIRHFLHPLYGDFSLCYIQIIG